MGKLYEKPAAACRGGLSFFFLECGGREKTSEKKGRKMRNAEEKG
jgi:hypothetical protein